MQTPGSSPQEGMLAGAPQPSGTGFLPIIAAAATVGAGIWQSKKAGDQQEAADKAAAERAQAAIRVAKINKRAAEAGSVPKWVWYTGAGVAVVGLAWWMLRRRKGGR